MAHPRSVSEEGSDEHRSAPPDRPAGSAAATLAEGSEQIARRSTEPSAAPAITATEGSASPAIASGAGVATSAAAVAPARLARAAGQGFRALTERWTPERTEYVVALLHAGDRTELAAYLDAEVPRVAHPTDPPGALDLKGIAFDALGYRVDFGQVRFERLNLWSSRFGNINLKGAVFRDCAMGLAVFHEAYLRGARFEGCDLHGATFSHASLDEARFERTSLRFSNWAACDIGPEAFGGALLEETSGKWAQARDIYRALRLNLGAAGDEAGAGWAAYRQCVMQRRDLRSRGRTVAWLASCALDLVWGYGERPWRLLLCSFVACVAFATAYFCTGLRFERECASGFGSTRPVSHFFECLYFSLATFTTVGYGDITPCGALSRSLAAFEAFGGIFTMGLFVTANVRKLEGR